MNEAVDKNKLLEKHATDLEAKIKSNQRFIDAITSIGQLVGIPYPDPIKVLKTVSERLAQRQIVVDIET